jgi:Tol biopolymer transport system component
MNPDGNQIALVCFDQNGERLNGVRILDLRGKLLRTLDEQAVAGAPTWSQDGSAIVYWVQNEATIHGQPGQSLWVVAADGSVAPTRLTSDPSIDSVPAISPDGKWIVYVQATNEHRDGDLYLIKTGTDDQGEPTIASAGRMDASETGVVDHDPTWSPDSSLIVYSSKGVLMKVPPDVRAGPEPLFGSARTNLHMPAWARR